MVLHRNRSSYSPSKCRPSLYSHQALVVVFNDLIYTVHVGANFDFLFEAGWKLQTWHLNRQIHPHLDQSQMVQSALKIPFPPKLYTDPLQVYPYIISIHFLNPFNPIQVPGLLEPIPGIAWRKWGTSCTDCQSFTQPNTFRLRKT